MLKGYDETCFRDAYKNGWNGKIKVLEEKRREEIKAFELNTDVANHTEVGAWPVQ